MVYNILNHWGFGFCPLSGTLKTRKKNKVSETECFHLQVKEGREGDTCSVGFLPSPEDGNRSRFQNLFFLFSEYQMTGQRNLKILSKHILEK
jgi:hypothetical protein